MISPTSKKIKIYFLSSISFYIFLFLFEIFLSGRFKYLGVETQKGAQIIKQFFSLSFLFFHFKVFVFYLVVSLIIGFLLFFAFYNLKISLKFFPSFLIILHLSLLFKNFILYPQFFTETAIPQKFFIFLTDNINPIIFEIPILFFIFLLVISILKKFKAWTIFIILIIYIITKTPAPKNLGSNIVFIGIDSLRNDRINKTTTPFLYKLIYEDLYPSKRIYCKNFYVSLPRTFPEIVTILTGILPDKHRIFHMFPESSVRDQKKFSLVNYLKKNGYKSAVISDFSGDIFPRVDLGFDYIETPYFNFNTIVEQRVIQTHWNIFPYIFNNFLGDIFFNSIYDLPQIADPFLLVKKTKKILPKISQSKFFIMLFFSTPHFPYASPYPYYNYFSQNYYGKYKYMKPNIPDEPVNIPQKEVKQINALYDGAVRSVDEGIKELFHFFQKKNLLKDTIFVFFADHGEQLYEFERGQGHGEHLYGNDVLNVPLIIVDFRKNSQIQIYENLVQDVDIYPTILDMVELKTPEHVEGISIFSNKKRDFVYAETGIWFTDLGDAFYQKKRIKYPDILDLATVDLGFHNEVVIKPEYREKILVAKHRMIQKNGWRLIYIPTYEDAIWELYDVRNDPKCLRKIDNESKKQELKNELIDVVKKNGFYEYINGYFVIRR